MNSRDNMRNGIFSAQGSKDSAVLFVAGDNKMKDHTNRTNTFRRAHKMFMALLIALTMMISAAVQGVSAFAANNNDTVRVATYDQLQEALEETKGVKEIVVDPQAAVDEGEVVYSVEGDENNNAFYIGFDEALTVSDDITITSADDVDVYFARSDSFRNDQDKPALLNIESEGKLNLDGFITMSGEEVATAFYEANEVNPAEFVFSVKSKDGTGEDNEVWNSDQALKGGFYIQNNGGEYTLGDDVVMKDINLADDVEDAEQIHEEKAASSNEEEVVVEKSADAAESTDSEEVAGVWEEKKEEATEEEEAVVAPAPKRMMMKSAGAQALRNGGTAVSAKIEVDDNGVTTVATSKQLEAALKHKDVKTIIIDESGVFSEVEHEKEGGGHDPATIEASPSNPNKRFYLPVDAPLTVDKTVEIKTNNNKEVVIARSNKFSATDESDSAIFNVTSKGNLTLSSKVTMTGDKVTSEYTYSDGDSGYNPGQGYEAAIESGVLKIQSLDGKYFGLKEGHNTVSLVGAEDANKRTLSLENGFLVIYYEEMGGNKRISWKLQWINGAGNDQDLRLVALDNNGQPENSYATSLSKDKTYVITWTDANGGKHYIGPYGEQIDNNSSLDNAFRFSAMSTASDTEDTEGQDYVAPKFKFNVDHMDGTTGNSAAWTATDIPGDDYRGFFINAADGGKVTINDGVTIGNLKTKCGFELKDKPYEENPYSDDTVFNAAPIYVGGGATLDFKGGVITGNEVGYGEGIEAHSQSSVQNLKKWFNDSAPTNTAGAIIASGENTNVTISGNATITGNKADAGAIIIKDAAKVTMNATKASKGDTATDAEKVRGISYNVGWHHSGAVLVENGGEFLLEDGSIHNNVAWLKGGAVWATEFGTIGLVRWTKYPTAMQHSDDVRKNRDGGKFVMNGGELTDNFSFVRAGAVEVESNYVYLNNGTISNNMCKSLGGAIYIEGDSPIYSYTLNLRNGYIHDNTAVDSVPDDDLDRRLVDGKLSAKNDSGNNAYSLSVGWHKDGDWANYGQKHSGDGGGIWLCSMGGTSVFTSTKDEETNPNKKAQVYIAGNHASSKYDTVTDNGWGDDFYISHRHGSALVQNLIGDWYGDDGKNGVAAKSDPIDTEDEKGIVMKGPKGMYNAVTSYSNVDGIQIIGNRARNGGAIACNGTIILGSASSVYRYEAEFDITKAWEDGVAESEVTLRLFYDANKNGKFDESTDFLLEKDATLDANESPYYEVKLGAGEGITPTGNEVIYKTGKNTAKASIPSSVQHNGQTIELYKIKNQQAKGPILMGNSDTHIDTTDKAHLEALFKYLNTNGSKEVPLDIDWFVGIQEDGDKYSTTLQTATATATSRVGKTVKLVNPDNGEEISEGSFTVNFSDVTFGQTLTNGLNYADVKLTKARLGDTSKKIGGAEFSLYKAVVGSDIFVLNSRPADGAENNAKVEAYKTTTSTADGEISFDKVDKGAYLLFETKAAPGYEIPKSPWFLFVDGSGKVTVSEMKDGTGLNPVKVGDVKTLNNSGLTTTVNEPYNASDLNKWVLAKWWGKSWFNLKNTSNTTGDKEEHHPRNVEFADSGDGTILDEDNILTNEPIVLYKKNNDTNPAPLENVTFRMYGVKLNNNNDGDKLTRGDVVKTNGGSGDDLSVTSNEKGEVDITTLLAPAGTFGSVPSTKKPNLYGTGKRYLALYEDADTTPDMYKVPTMPWLVVIDANGQVEVREAADKYSDKTEWTLDDFNKVVYSRDASAIEEEDYKILENDRAVIELVKEGTDELLITGAKFKLYAVQLKANRYETTTNPLEADDPKAFGSEIVSNEGKVDITEAVRAALDVNSDWRKFIIVETAVSDSSKYILPKAPWLITIDNHGKVVSVERHEEANNENYSGQDFAADNPKKWIGWNADKFKAVDDQKLLNIRIYKLPNAGGMGTYWFMIIGAMMMGFALTAGFMKMNLLKLLRR